MNEKIEKIHIVICLFAALVVDAFCIFYKVSLINTAIRLIATIVIFYVIGSFIRYFIMKNIFPAPEDTIASPTDQEIEDIDGSDTNDLSEMDEHYDDDEHYDG